MDARSVRMLLDKMLRSDSDFDSFCHDYFPGVYHRFSNSMDRIQKTTILLQQIPQFNFIAQNLREYCRQTNQPNFGVESRHECKAAQPARVVRRRRSWVRRDMKRAALLGSAFGVAMKAAEALWETIARFLSGIWSWTLKRWGGSQVAASITLTTLTSVTLGGITTVATQLHQTRTNRTIAHRPISPERPTDVVNLTDLAEPQDLVSPKDFATLDALAGFRLPKTVTSPKDLAPPTDPASPKDLAPPSDLASPEDLAPPSDLVSPKEPTPPRVVTTPYDMEKGSLSSQPEYSPVASVSVAMRTHPCVNKDGISTSFDGLFYYPDRNDLKINLIELISRKLYYPEIFSDTVRHNINVEGCKLKHDRITADMDLKTSIPKDYLGREIYHDRYNLICDVTISLIRKSSTDVKSSGSGIQLHMRSDSNSLAKQKFLAACRVASRDALQALLETLTP